MRGGKGGTAEEAMAVQEQMSLKVGTRMLSDPLLSIATEGWEGGEGKGNEWQG